MPNKKSTKSTNGWKTCTRGHKYRGEQCPICWPGGQKKKKSAPER